MSDCFDHQEYDDSRDEEDYSIFNGDGIEHPKDMTKEQLIRKLGIDIYNSDGSKKTTTQTLKELSEKWKQYLKTIDQK